MSARYMGDVWELRLQFYKAWVLMAMAEPDQETVSPSVDLIMWKTGYSESSVRRILSHLRADGILVPCGHAPNGAVTYKVELSHVARKTPFKFKDAGRPKFSDETSGHKTLANPSAAHKPGFVYVLRAHNDLYKIGKSIDLKSRLAMYRSHSAEPPEVVLSWHVDNMDVSEKELLWRFEDKKSHGEWFKLTPQDVESLKLYGVWGNQHE